MTGGESRVALGRAGEALAEEYLAGLGYEIITRNWRTCSGELDLIARDGDWLVFVEVRTRRAAREGGAPIAGLPEESVTPRKQLRLAALANEYLFKLPWNGPKRIDVIALELWPDGRIARLAHYQDAVGGAL